MFLLHTTLQNQQLNLIRLSNSYGTGTDSGNSALNYGHKFPRHGTAEGGDDFIGQSRVTQLIKQGRSLQLLGEQHSLHSERGAGSQQGQGVPLLCQPAQAFRQSCCTRCAPLQRWQWWLCGLCLSLGQREQPAGLRRGQEAGRGTEGRCTSCFICSDAWPC